MRILEVCSELDGGGIEHYVYSYCTRIKSIFFDYSSSGDKVGMLEPLLEKNGSSVYKVPRIKKGICAHIKKLKSIMKNGHYDAVHAHLGYKSFIVLSVAKLCGVKVRIAHAHLAFVPENVFQRSVRKVCTFLTKRVATDLAACGEDAARWTWGESQNKRKDVIILRNAIDTKTYAYSESIRKKLREEFGFGERDIVVGNVGRLSKQKNQTRLIEIFEDVLKINPKSVLFLVGRGDLEPEIRRLIEIKKMSDHVIMLGIRNDVADLLNMMDVFVLPSTYEGFPFVLVETQCNGLRSVCSDAVTKLCKVSDVLDFLSLDDSNDLWAKKILSEAVKGHEPGARNAVREAGFDIDEAARELELFYLARIKPSSVT